jgi:hypothetical protein
LALKLNPEPDEPESPTIVIPDFEKDPVAR